MAHIYQCWHIVIWTLRNKLQWKCNRNWYIFIKENAFENVICNMGAIFSRPPCVNSLRPNDASMRRYTNHHWFRQWLVAWTAPSHYLNQCWNIVNWTLTIKLQWNFNRNLNIFIQENALEHVVYEMASIFSQPQCVKGRKNCCLHLTFQTKLIRQPSYQNNNSPRNLTNIPDSKEG